MGRGQDDTCLGAGRDNVPNSHAAAATEDPLSMGTGHQGPQSQYFPILRTICQASKSALGLTSIPPAERKENPKEEVKISLGHC